MRVIRLCVAVLLTIGLAACTGTGEESASSSAPTSTPTPTAEGETAVPSGEVAVPEAGDVTGPEAGGATLPAAGQCWNFTGEQLDPALAATSTDAAVAECSAEHNAITAGVVGIPTDQVGSVAALAQSGNYLDPVNEQAWRAVVLGSCSAAYTSAYGAGRVSAVVDGVALAYKATTLRPVAWVPSADEWAGGARWIRCDVANRAGEPTTEASPNLAIETIPDDLVACINANDEGYLPVACDSDLVNAQEVVTVVLDEATTQSAVAAYDAFSTGQVLEMCASLVGAAFPNANKEVKAALPIQPQFTGTFDCYVDHTPGDPYLQ